MKSVDMLQGLPGELGLVDPAAVSSLRRFLRQVVHDLNNPMGTLGIELYSMGLATERLQAAVQAGDVEGIRELAETFREMQQNVAGAQQKACKILAAMEEGSASWTDEADAGARRR